MDETVDIPVIVRLGTCVGHQSLSYKPLDQCQADAPFFDVTLE